MGEGRDGLDLWIEDGTECRSTMQWWNVKSCSDHAWEGNNWEIGGREEGASASPESVIRASHL